MKVFLHWDNCKASEVWFQGFRKALDRRNIKTEIINLIQTSVEDILSQREPNDFFVARFNESSWPLAKRKYYNICDAFKEKIFPSPQQLLTYDDKLRQLEWLSRNNFPIPASAYVQNSTDLGYFLNYFQINFPIVSKTPAGSSSAGVSLHQVAETIQFPCLVQEYHFNKQDLRICVIGRKAFGFERQNRPNDFRASGSGQIIYSPELPLECVQMAFQICEALNVTSMCFDFLKTENQWLISEMSYTYRPEAVEGCNYYYTLDLAQRQSGRLSIPELVLKELLQFENVKLL